MFHLLYDALLAANMTLISSAWFTSGDKHSIEAALEVFKESMSRITILVGVADDASQVMRIAKEMEMTGKGWLWVGVGWVQPHLWVDNLSEEQAEELLEALQGLVGVIPDDDEQPRFLGGKLMKYQYKTDGSNGGDAKACPELNKDMYKKGVSTSAYVPYGECTVRCSGVLLCCRVAVLLCCCVVVLLCCCVGRVASDKIASS